MQFVSLVKEGDELLLIFVRSGHFDSMFSGYALLSLSFDAERRRFDGVTQVLDVNLGHSVKCLFSIQNYRVKATFYRVSLMNLELTTPRVITQH